jgi:TPR repeat protein
MYHQEIGVREDPSEASKGHIFAVEKTDGNPQCQLGILRLNGQGLSKDLGKAINWFLESAAQNNPDSYY